MSNDLDNFKEKLAKAQERRDESPENMRRDPKDPGQNMSFGMRVGIELFAGVLVGGILGYAIDYVANTLPLFLIIFLIVGAVAGLWNVYKTMSKDFSQK